MPATFNQIPIDTTNPINWADFFNAIGSASHSATSWSATNAGTGGVWQFTGAGFGNYQGNVPFTGTITGITYSVNGVTLFSVSGASADVFTFLTAGLNGDWPTAVAGLYPGADAITGTSGADRLLGFAGSDTLIGGDGDDSFYASAGNDSLQGQSGNDTFIWVATDGRDTFNGNDGDDFISGGGGGDNLIGGLGQGVFIYQAGAGADTINDFDAWAAGGQDFINVQTLGINAGNFASRVTIIDTGADTVVRIDSDIFITLKNVSGDGDNVITISDFILGP